MKVREIMKIPFKVDRNINLGEVAEKMSNNGIGSIIVVEGDKIKGIVTERDLIKNFGKKEKIFEVMSKNVVSVDAEADIFEALELMRESRIKRLPVVHENRLVGVLSITDIIAELDVSEGDFFFN